VQEFRVSTSLVSAEFGGFGGGVIEISTKSGTNAFHGNAYEYIRNTDLEANDWFSNHDGIGKAPLHQNQFGANLGGPVLKNRLFFFFTWEHESLLSSGPAAYWPEISPATRPFTTPMRVRITPQTASHLTTTASLVSSIRRPLKSFSSSHQMSQR
jgi:hypothetical protein